jgi:hypothetical protein
LAGLDARVPARHEKAGIVLQPFIQAILRLSVPLAVLAPLDQLDPSASPGRV